MNRRELVSDKGLQPLVPNLVPGHWAGNDSPPRNLRACEAIRMPSLVAPNSDSALALSVEPNWNSALRTAKPDQFTRSEHSSGAFPDKTVWIQRGGESFPAYFYCANRWLGGCSRIPVVHAMEFSVRGCYSLHVSW